MGSWLWFFGYFFRIVLLSRIILRFVEVDFCNFVYFLGDRGKYDKVLMENLLINFFVVFFK